MGRVKTLYLDESGDHNLIVVDPQYPIFVLGGVIVDQDYAEGPLTEALNGFKREMFGRTDIVLHTADIVRNRNGFEKLADAGLRRAFYDRLNGLMRSLDYTVVACAIRKDEHVKQYGRRARNPYLLSLHVLVERFCYSLGKDPADGTIIAEGRGLIEDRRLEATWTNMQNWGTDYVDAKTINQRITGLSLRPKGDNIPGLQLADLVVSPVARYVLGKPTMEDWRIVESKLRRSDTGATRGFGLIVLPK